MNEQCHFCGNRILMLDQKIDGKHFHKLCAAPYLAMGFTLNDRAAVTKLIEQLHTGPCPHCGLHEETVDCYRFMQCTGMLLLTTWHDGYDLCCRNCYSKLRWKANRHSLLLGWWSLPGIVLTPMIIFTNFIPLYRGGKLLRNYLANPEGFFNKNGYLTGLPVQFLQWFGKTYIESAMATANETHSETAA